MYEIIVFEWTCEIIRFTLNIDKTKYNERNTWKKYCDLEVVTSEYLRVDKFWNMNDVHIDELSSIEFKYLL